jgi:hypothetical protein
MKKIFKEVALNKGWKKVNLRKYNDFYLTAVKKDEMGKEDTLNKDCVKRIRFEVAMSSGKKGKYLTFNYITLNFNDITSSDSEVNKITAATKALNYPSTFYIRAIDMTGEFSTVTEGNAAIEVYVNELRLK